MRCKAVVRCSSHRCVPRQVLKDPVQRVLYTNPLSYANFGAKADGYTPRSYGSASSRYFQEGY